MNWEVFSSRSETTDNARNIFGQEYERNRNLSSSCLIFHLLPSLLSFKIRERSFLSVPPPE